MVPTEHAILLATLLFAIGAVGAIARRNLIAMLTSLQLMLAAVNLAFVAFNRIWTGDGTGAALDGHVFALLVTAVSAAQLAVGLGLVVALVRNRDSVNVEDMSVLKW